MKFDVYISKAYFPKGKKDNQYDDRYKSWEIDAGSRDEAARKAWEMDGADLLGKMNPYENRFPLRVSLYVSDPTAPGASGAAGRLQPIRVWEGWPQGSIKRSVAVDRGSGDRGRIVIVRIDRLLGRKP